VLYRTYKPQVLAISKEQPEAGKNQVIHASGPEKAPVTIEEFGAFQCPPCGALSELLN
jgi:hypothetical protein